MKSYIARFALALQYDRPDYYPGADTGSFADRYIGCGSTAEEAILDALDQCSADYETTDPFCAAVMDQLPELEKGIVVPICDAGDDWQYFAVIWVDPAGDMPEHFLACTCKEHYGAALFRLDDGSDFLDQENGGRDTLAQCWPPYSDIDDVQGILDDYAPYFVCHWSGNFGLELELTMEQAKSCSVGGQDNGPAVKELLQDATIREQVDKWNSERLRKELREYGAWTDAELRDDEQNQVRLLWIACGDIAEGR